MQQTNVKTEERNPRTVDIDLLEAGQIVRLIQSEDFRVPPRLADCGVSDAVARAAAVVAHQLKAGGRLIYAGAGTSGRLAMLDAAEIPPTYGFPADRIAVCLAGGPGAFMQSKEGAEDDRAAGKAAVSDLGVGAGDVLIGVAASGRTPYTIGAVEEARTRGAATVAITSNPGSELGAVAAVAIEVDTGPEVIAGSTRMKAGTAQKLILNTVSTTAMILGGRVYSNLMAGVKPANAKLRQRAAGIVAQATGRDGEEVREALRESGWDLILAILMLKKMVCLAEACRLLEAAGGDLRTALGERERLSGDQLGGGRPGAARRAPAWGGVPGITGAAGLDPVQLNFMRQLLDQAVVEGDIPGAVAAVGTIGGVEFLHVTGHASLRPTVEPMREDTLFDLASLTKVVATTPVAMVFLERGLFRLDDPVAMFLPDFAGDGGEGESQPAGVPEQRRKVRIRHLLTHTSGLPAFERYYKEGLDREAILRRARTAPLVFEPGTQVLYSDLGFMVLEQILEKIGVGRLDQLAHDLVFGPLGMKDTGFCPGPDRAGRAAATEYRADLGRYMKGEVHDENALAMGGVSGHAGLFSTCADLVLYARTLLSDLRGWPVLPSLLSPATVRAMIRPQTPGPNDARGLGWAARGTELSSGGDLLSSSAFGHTGFTGTSLWIDPETGIFAVLLTNRVHLGRENERILRLRPRFHNAIAAAARRSRSTP